MSETKAPSEAAKEWAEDYFDDTDTDKPTRDLMQACGANGFLAGHSYAIGTDLKPLLEWVEKVRELYGKHRFPGDAEAELYELLAELNRISPKPGRSEP